MLVAILGVIDLLAGIAVLFANTDLFLGAGGLYAILGLFLIAKGGFFAFGDLHITNFLDIACGLLIIVSTITTLPLIFIILMAIYLIQKGIFSFSSFGEY